MRLVAAGLLAWSIAWMGCGNPVVSRGVVEALSTQVVVRQDGSVDVEDTFRIVPDDRGDIAFHHVVQTRYADDLTFEGATIDGEELTPGSGGFSIADRPAGVAVTWQPGSMTPDPVALVLRYRAVAAVGVREPRGRLEWPVLKSGRGFDVDAVEVSLVLPDGVRLYDGTGMAEAGWTVAFTQSGIAAQRVNVAADETATLLAVFDVDRAAVVQPGWEWDLDRQEQYFLALIAGALFILVIGVGVLVLLGVQYRRPAPGAPLDVVHAAETDRRMVTKGLRISGWVGVVFAALCAALAHAFLSGLGWAVQAMPASMVLVSVAFLLASAWYGRMEERG